MSVGAKQESREVWVYVDARNERLFKNSLGVLTKARALAESAAGRTAAVLLGCGAPGVGPDSDDSPPPLPLDTAAERCAARGADAVYVIDHTDLRPLRADAHASALQEAIAKRNPLVVLFALSDLGRDLAARCSGATGGGSIAKCLSLRAQGDTVVATCPSGEGKFLAEIAFSDMERTGFATVLLGAEEPVGEPDEPAPIVRLEGIAPKPSGEVTLISSAAESPQAQSLEDAEIVVVGGAGLGNAEGFAMARELAAVLGGELAATRPPVMQHWISEERMIGQTGKSVQPKLLFSIATSGATQYTSGITDAKTVVAINRDPNAPIFRCADVGVVADAKVLVPQLIDKIKQTVMRELAEAVSSQAATAKETGMGQKIRQLRKTREWSREALGQATGKSPEFISQVENDQVTPSVAFLLRLARALDTAPDTFLHQEQKTQIADQRAQAFVTRTQNYSYQTLTPEAKAEHLRAFMVEIEPKQAHKPVAYKHEGEEFILIQEGELEINLGGKKHTLKAGESIHFNSETPHKLKSISDIPTKCVVVLYTP